MPNNIRTIEKTMLVIEVIALNNGRLRLSEIAEYLDLNKSTLHGILRTLCDLGYISRDGQLYTLGLRLRDVARPLHALDEYIRKLYRPALKALSSKSGETCWLAVPCGLREYLYIDAIEGSEPYKMVSPRGKRESLLTSAIGKVIIAHDDNLLRTLRKYGEVTNQLEKELKIIKETGYSIDKEISETGLNCLAIPLMKEGKTIAALGMAGPAKRLQEAYMVDFIEQFLHEKFDIIKL